MEVFEVPLTSAPTCIKGRFIDEKKSELFWDLEGLDFGVGQGTGPC